MWFDNITIIMIVYLLYLFLDKLNFIIQFINVIE